MTEDRNSTRIRHLRLKEILASQGSDYEKALKRRTDKVDAMLGAKFKILTKEAVSILCGLSEAQVVQDLEGTDLHKVIHETEKYRQIGESVYGLTRDTLLIFGDLQHLSTSSEELEDLLRQFNNDLNVIPQFMKNCLLYDVVITARGVMRPYKCTQEEAEKRAIRLRDHTAIGSFYTMIGLLVVKYGKEKVVEEFLVPKVFNGDNGIINIITQNFGNRR